MPPTIHPTRLTIWCTAPDTSWALGSYYQPTWSNYATSTKWAVTIEEDFTARLETEYCDGPQPFVQMASWRVISDRQIELYSPEDSEALDWFGLVSDAVRMRLSDDPDIVVVSDGDNEEGPTLGDFRRGTGCLKLVDAALGCFGGGAYVFPCDGD